MGTDAQRDTLLRRFAAFWVGPIDTRPLALMRITFGVALVGATLDVAPVLRDLLTDEGILPRGALLSGLARTARFSVFDVAGPTWISWLLLLGTLVATVCFAVGFHTRAATVLSFFLVSGLHERNLAVFDGADNVIRVMLFFLMFAPAGDHYSLDALRRPAVDRLPAEGRSGFTIRLIELQFAWVYLGSALGKVRGPTWRDGTALHYALSLDHLFTRKLGAMLADVRAVVVPATYGTLVFEGAFVLLVFSPVGRKVTRAIAVVCGVALHVGIGLTMRVGNFSHLMIACYPLFLEPEWAERIARFFERRLGLGALAHLTPVLGEPRRAAPPLSGGPAVALRALLGALLVAAMWFSFPQSPAAPILTQPSWMRSTVQGLELWQSWDMFAPDPARADFYLRGSGLLDDGKVVDVLHDLPGGPLPPAVPGFFFTRWTKLIANLAFAEPPPLSSFGRFLCARWNLEREGRPPLMTFKIYREERPTAPLGDQQKPWQERLIWDHHCF